MENVWLYIQIDSIQKSHWVFTPNEMYSYQVLWEYANYFHLGDLGGMGYFPHMLHLRYPTRCGHF